MYICATEDGLERNARKYWMVVFWEGVINILLYFSDGGHLAKRQRKGTRMAQNGAFSGTFCESHSLSGRGPHGSDLCCRPSAAWIPWGCAGLYD